MIEGIRRLRKYVCEHTHENVSGPSNDFDNSARPLDVLTIADAIEREVEERYVERPVDADGMVIAHSDNMVDSNGERFMVSSIELLASGEWILYGNGKLGSELAKLCHHHKPPTVEDVLEELCLEYVKSWNGESSKSERREVVAEYAAKLQLREEEEL